MQNKKRTILLLFYYLLVSGLTNLVYVVLAVIILGYLPPIWKVDTNLIIILFFFLLEKSLIIGSITYWAQKHSRFDKASGTKYLGGYYGRFFGLFIGVFKGVSIARGAHKAEGISVVIGIFTVFTFYFTGRWIGPKVGLLISHLVDNYLPIQDGRENATEKSLPSRKLFIVLYSAFFPWLMVLTAFLLQMNNMQFNYSLSNWLPVARFVVIAISFISFVAPWLIQKRLSQKQMKNSGLHIFLIGLSFSALPVIYAFCMFLIMDASIIEVSFFAVASSLAAIIWSIKTSVENPKVGEAGY